jgi:hypothetical protein
MGNRQLAIGNKHRVHYGSGLKLNPVTPQGVRAG